VHYSDDRFAQYIASHLPLEVMVKHTGCCYSVVATIIALDTTMHVFDATNGCNWRFEVFKDENDLLGVHKTFRDIAPLPAMPQSSGAGGAAQANAEMPDSKSEKGEDSEDCKYDSNAIRYSQKLCTRVSTSETTTQNPSGAPNRELHCKILTTCI
jgi:hypothetical protein